MNIFNKVTLKTLRKTKARTLVTIIGIILSVALITGVTTCVSSLQQFMIDTAVSQYGDWHGAVFDVTNTQIDKLKNNVEVKQFTSIQNIGYAKMSDSQNSYKPYLFIGGMSENFTKMMPVKITSGRMPENANEIILPLHLQTDGGIKHSIGDTLPLSIGGRMLAGSALNQNNGYVLGESEGTEELVVKENRTYTVVGFYERPSFEDFSAPGYTALTVADTTTASNFDAYIKLSTAKNIYSFLDTNYTENGSTTNANLLRFNGASNEGNLNAVLYGLTGVLILIIMCGGISLIYNSFSISVSERTKQFGLLSSIGATKKQIMHSVLFEASFLSLIGIPVGILCGIAGIGITFKLSENLFSSFLNTGNDVVLHLSVSWIAIAVAICIGIITVLLSAYIPAKRAVRISAIDAIRQNNDINISAKQIKTSRLTYMLFGFEGMIANKNFKRNKRKYRATVISLFMSVVLFISASSFCAYLTAGAASIVEKPGYDIVYSSTQSDLDEYSLEDLFKTLSGASGVINSAYSYQEYHYSKIAINNLNEDYINFCNSNPETAINPNSKYADIDVVTYFINNNTFEEYLKQNSYDPASYMDVQSPRAVVLDYTKIFNDTDGRYYTFNLLKDNSQGMDLKQIKEIDGYYYSKSEVDDNGRTTVTYENPDGKSLSLPLEEATENTNHKIGTISNARPFCVDNNLSGAIILLYPYSAIAAVTGKQPSEKSVEGNSDDIKMYFKANNSKVVYNNINNILVEKGLTASRSNLYNYTETIESQRSIVTVINIFSYGFIILISLIAAANVFNTISTNIGLRRREFAMLKSIGMTQKGFNKMMNFECILYGLKGLIYGIPVSVGVTYLIYRSMLRGWETNFFIPWHSLVIAVGSVFAVVFSTMLYSMRKIKKDNAIDALRNENL